MECHYSGNGLETWPIVKLIDSRDQGGAFWHDRESWVGRHRILRLSVEQLARGVAGDQIGPTAISRRCARPCFDLTVFTNISSVPTKAPRQPSRSSSSKRNKRVLSLMNRFIAIWFRHTAWLLRVRGAAPERATARGIFEFLTSASQFEIEAAALMESRSDRTSDGVSPKLQDSELLPLMSCVRS